MRKFSVRFVHISDKSGCDCTYIMEFSYKCKAKSNSVIVIQAGWAFQPETRTETKKEERKYKKSEALSTVFWRKQH